MQCAELKNENGGRRAVRAARVDLSENEIGLFVANKPNTHYENQSNESKS